MAVADLLFRITGKLDGSLTGSVEQAERALGGLNTVAGKTSGVLGSLFPPGGLLERGATGVAASIGNLARQFTGLNAVMGSLGVGLVVNDFLKTTGSLTDLSAQTDITIRDLQRFKFAGGQVGVGLEQIVSSVSLLQARLGDNNTGAIGALDKMGIGFGDIQRLNPGELFQRVAVEISKIEDPLKRADAAREVFGRGGMALLPLLRQNMKDLGDEAERLGAILEDDVVAGGDKAGENIAKATEVVKGFIGSWVLGPIIKGVEELGRAIDDARVKTGNFTKVANFGPAIESIQIVTNKLGQISNIPQPKLFTPEAMKPLTMSMAEADKLGKELTKGILEQIKAHDDAQKAANAHAASIKALADRYSGNGAIKAANDMLEALRKMPPVIKLTRTAQDDINKVMEEALDVYRAQGREAPAAIRAVAAATMDLNRLMPTVREGMASVFTEVGTTVRDLSKDILELYDILAKMPDIEIGPPSNLPGTPFKPGIPAAPPASMWDGLQGSIDTVARSFFQLGSVTDSLRVRGIAAFMNGLDLALKSSQAFGTGLVNLTKGIGSIVGNLSQIAGAAVGGAGAVISATGSGSTGSRIGKGALTGAAIGANPALIAATGGLSIAVGALAGAIVGWARGRNQGRNLVEDFAKQMGGFDALRERMNELGDEGEALWIKLTQGVGKGDSKGAQAAIDAVTEAFQRQKEKISEIGREAEQAAADTIKAQEAMVAPLKDRIANLGQEYDRLFDSIRDEAPEEVMGIVEQQTRARMEAVARERDQTQQELEKLQESFKESMGGVTQELKDQTGIAARDMILELEDAFTGAKIKIPYEFVPTNTLPGVPGSLSLPTGTQTSSTRPASVREPATQNISVNVDGHVIAQAAVRGMPRELELYGVRG
jgi:hypothetical protein